MAICRGEAPPISFEIQVSPDREAWATIAELEGGAAGMWHSLAWSGETRYVRFRFANPNGDLVLGYLAEVRIIG